MPANHGPHGSADCASTEPAVPFADLIEKARAGSQEAMQALYERYRDAVLGFIRRHLLGLHDPLRRDLDSTDLGQETWLSVFEAIKKGKTFRDADTFVLYLLAITRNIYRNRVRARMTTEKRSMRREQALGAADERIAADEPGPAALAAAADEWQTFLGGMRLVPRTIFVCLDGGDTPALIADLLGLNVRTVQRIIECERRRWRAREGGGVNATSQTDIRHIN